MIEREDLKRIHALLLQLAKRTRDPKVAATFRTAAGKLLAHMQNYPEEEPKQ